jgi:hypothetical protein
LDPFRFLLLVSFFSSQIKLQIAMRQLLPTITPLRVVLVDLCIHGNTNAKTKT